MPRKARIDAPGALHHIIVRIIVGTGGMDICFKIATNPYCVKKTPIYWNWFDISI